MEDDSKKESINSKLSDNESGRMSIVTWQSRIRQEGVCAPGDEFS